MAKKIREDVEPTEMQITAEDITKYRKKVYALPKGKVPRSDRFMVEVGAAKLDERGWLTVTNPELFAYWVRVRDHVEELDAIKNKEIRDLFPEENEKHRAKLKTYSEQMRQVVLGKRYDPAD